MRNVSECLYSLYAWFFIVSSLSWMLSKSSLNTSLCTDPVSDITVFVLKRDAKLQPTNLMYGAAHLNTFYFFAIEIHVRCVVVIVVMVCLHHLLMWFIGYVVVAAAYQCIVRALYNLLVVQFAASVSFKLSAAEQKLWLVKGQTAGCSKLESLLSRVIGLLTGSSLFHFDLPESQIPAVSF